MVPLTSLWAPILVSAVVVFVASSIIHMALPIHRNDFRKAPSEDALLDALRGFGVTPGDYVVPCAGSPAVMKTPEFKEKMKRGPVVFMTVFPPYTGMGARLALWFVYLLVVGIFAGYVAGRALGPGAPYLSVFRFAGCVAFVAYGIGLWQNSIWYGRAWLTTIKSNVDALVYGLLTAGVFGWLWPK